MKISLLMNMKMPTIVGIFIFISRENFMLNCVEHEKSLKYSGPGRFSIIFKMGDNFCDFLFAFWHSNEALFQMGSVMKGKNLLPFLGQFFKHAKVLKPPNI